MDFCNVEHYSFRHFVKNFLKSKKWKKTLHAILQKITNALLRTSFEKELSKEWHEYISSYYVASVVMVKMCIPDSRIVSHTP